MDSVFVNFGKYSGKSLQEIGENDPSYLIWLKKQPYISDEIKEAIADDIIPDTMTFGRYKHKQSVDWVFKNDPMYFNWLLSNKFIKENMTSLYSRVLELHNDSLTNNL